MPKPPTSNAGRWRTAAAAATAWLAVVALTGAIAASAPAPAPAPAPGASAKLLVLSTSDLKGKTSPCGCHTPKGGFSRREGMADSLRTEGPILVVDGGGWFPEGDSTYHDVAAFIAREFVNSHSAAVGIGDRELHYGLGFLRALVRGNGVPATCTNLLERASGRPVFTPWRIVPAGRAKVGILALMGGAKADLGPSKDSLTVGEPVAAAHAALEAMHAKGATVIVLLSDLGKVETEDLVGALPGIDVAIVGHDPPMLPQGRRVQGTIAAYSGDQGHFLGVTRVTLDAAGHALDAVTESVVLGPDIPEQPAALARVKGFEDAFNEKLRREQSVLAAQTAQGSGAGTEDMPSHFVGAEVCARCHAPEAAQWRTTAHAHAWKSLVDVHKDATPDCVRCHVVGYQQPGGFQSGADAAALANVQCENCHGMGTDHFSWPARSAKLSELTCRNCHTEETSPVFDFAVYQPHVVHHPPDSLPPLPPRPKTRSAMMR
jgi:2',3'-cyclic-nucleotide 2'-phosphodiesterase (5'-nucleotidase family)